MIASASAGPDAVRAQQHLEAAPLVVVHEPVEDDGVLAHMGVHEERGLGRAAVPAVPAVIRAAAVAGVTVTR